LTRPQRFLYGSEPASLVMIIVGAALSLVVLYGSFEIIRDAASVPPEAGTK